MFYLLAVNVKEVVVEVEASFGRWMQRRRKALDLTQEELAQRVGCAAETLRKIEANARRPSHQIAERLAEALEMPEVDRAVFIKAARGNLAAVDQLKHPTQDLLSQIRPNFQTKPFDGRCPYKGLDVFEEEDAEFFFGRERLVEDLVSRVKQSRTVFVIGPSGSGKSSLVRAGLIHALKQGAIESLHSERWSYETMKPGRDPIGELGQVVSSLAGTTKAGDELREKASTDNDILARWCEIALKEGRNKRAVLFIDQFEEIFTQVNKEEERLAFLHLVTQAATAESGRVIVLFAMRSDFVMKCATYPKLNALFNQQSIQIGAMEPHELANAIAQPALSVGLPIERELIEQIIADMQAEPGALPLMQFALKDLFDSQQAKGIGIGLTLNDYRQRGGLHSSLERHADRSFAKLQANEQELARSIFSGLVEVGRGAQDTRRTALFDELIPSDSNASEIQNVVQKLADARLITTDEQAGKDIVTISHEKLIDAWPWLKQLVEENRDVIALQNEIANDAKEWDVHQREVSYLYRGARLATVREHLDAKKLILSGMAREFIEIGVTANINELEEAKNRADRLFRLTEIAVARQLAAQAQSLFTAPGSKQIAILLATQSMKLFPTVEAAQVILNNNFVAPSIVRMVHDNEVTSVAFSWDGKYVVSGSTDHTARVWEVATRKEIARMTHNGVVSSLALSPDGKLVASGGKISARVWEASTGREIARITHNNFVIHVPQDARVTSLIFSLDGKYIVSGSTDKTVRIWEALTGKEVTLITCSSRVDSVAFSPDGKYVVSGSLYGTVDVWEASTGKEIAHMKHGGFSRITSITFSPDGKYIVSGGSDNTARVWETTTGKEVIRMTHDFVVYAMALSPDAKYVVVGSGDRTVRVWDLATGSEIARITHDSAVRSIAISPDGKNVISGSEDHTARVWEAFTGKEFARLIHDDNVNSVAFSPDGRYVASAGDRTVRIWLWQSNDLISKVCTHLSRNLTRAEWKQYVGDVLPYEAVCPNLPVEHETIPAPNS